MGGRGAGRFGQEWQDLIDILQTSLSQIRGEMDSGKCRLGSRSEGGCPGSETGPGLAAGAGGRQPQPALAGVWGVLGGVGEQLGGWRCLPRWDECGEMGWAGGTHVLPRTC